MADVPREKLEQAWERARTRHPAVVLERDPFVEYLAAHDATSEALASASDDGLAELYLVAALHHRVPRASDAFETQYLARLPASLAKLRLSDADLDEVRQRVRLKLLIAGPAGSLGIERYAGRGRLGGLVHVTATREAVSLRRAERPTAPESSADVAAGLDPAAELLRGHAREAFHRAFAAAVRELPARDRTLLRMHLLRGVTLESLATMYAVHRATIVRWLASAREQVLSRTRALLRADLGLSAQELDSLMEAAQSRVDLTLERLFASDDGV
jgi:RNA polymerase sigma-70 factor, ECF subfamily